MADVVKVLRAEKQLLEQRLRGINEAITALTGGVKRTVKRVKHPMSAATKRKLSLAAKARWAKIKK